MHKKTKTGKYEKMFQLINICERFKELALTIAFRVPLWHTG